ncbi:MAG: biotin--[acetyl-CoA-carboxylase] ligase, partial [Halieaceae bacterium]|nr:biotin--[acetyl-CoA-carboxylase] ligase [Halieaceae bacterium]
LLRRASDLPDGFVCLAEQQSSGRGRRGRPWRSPFGRNLYLSVAWSYGGGAAALEGLSLAVGVALRDALAELGVGDVELKWPNDVLRRGAKLAGILVELAGSASGSCTAVVGVGVNLRMPVEDAAAIDQRWADLADLDVGRNRLAGVFLNRLLPLLADYERTGFAPWRDRWTACHAWTGKTVRVERPAGAFAGTALGVDERGALRVQTASGIETVYGGEVSLRVAS